MRFAPLCVHNVCFTVENVTVGEHWIHEETVGAVKLRVIFGVERDRVSCFVSCDTGMDRNACQFAIKRCVEIAEGRLGHKIGELVLKTLEANKDFVGCRLDGVTCLTVQGLSDTIERVYQKADGVRHEAKISKSMGLAELESLFQGGIAQYNVTQANFVMIQELRKVVETQKVLDAHVGELTKITQALFERQLKQDDGNGGR